jgi:hypothetical protein
MVTREARLKKILVFTFFLAFAPLARAQDAGHWETRVFTEVSPGHYEIRARQVWHDAWVEVTTRILTDGTIERVRIHHEGRWSTVTERVWVQGEERTVRRRVWVRDRVEYVNPWDETPRTCRTEAPTVITPPVRTEEPVSAPMLPQPTDKVERDPFEGLERSRPVPAQTPEKVEVDPLVPTPAPAPPQPPQVILVQPPAPPPREVVLVETPAPPPQSVVVVREPAPRVVCVETYPHRVSYDGCWPRVGVGLGVGLRVTRHVGVGVRIGF